MEGPVEKPAEEVRIRHDREAGRFVARLDGTEAHLAYREREDGVLDFVSTYVPPEHRGRGVAERVVLEGLRFAREAGRRIVPTCPYVTRVLERHPEFSSLVEDSG